MTGPIECVACSSRNVYAVEQWPVKKTTRAIACRDCGLLFLDPAPVRQEDETPPIVPEVSLAIGYPASSTGAPIKKGAAGALIAALDRHITASRPESDARVLDIWCGSGEWLNALQSYGWRTFGIEPLSDVAFARHERLTALPSAPLFDLILLYQGLQRSPHPLDALRELARAIRPGGHCLVSVPRLDTLGEHRAVHYCLGSRKSSVAFTEACLRGLLARAGFEVIAALDELDDAWTRGEPIRLALLARRVEHPVPVEPEPAAALGPVIKALSEPETTPAGPIECPACSSQNVERIDQWRLSKMRARAAACGECGLLFVHPQPSQRTLDAYYTPDGYAAWKAGKLTDKAWINLDSPERKTSRRTPSLMTVLDRYFPTVSASGARVLDFGCGPGTWLDHFQDHGWDTYGLEPCTDAAFVRHKKLMAVPSDAQFDLVFLYHVLEHLRRPLDTLTELARSVRPGGHLFVSVPRLDMIPVHREVEYCLHVQHHIVAFTEACLRGLLARAGLEVIASLSDLPTAFNRGMPTKLQLLARKGRTPPVAEPTPARALVPVIEAFVEINRKRA